MREAWGEAEQRNLEEIELIDIKTPDELRQTWEPFIDTHHYRISHVWEDSWTASYPRRTCEAMWQALMENDSPAPRRV